MPPLILAQAKLYTKGEMPTAFVTWAYLSDTVAERFARPPLCSRQLAAGEGGCKCLFLLAEAVRFELTDGFPHRWFSRPVP